MFGLNKNKKTEVVDNSGENKNAFFTFDELYKARTALFLSCATLIVTIIFLIVFFGFLKTTQNEILDRIQKRDIMVLTNRGAILGKTSPLYNDVVKQFSLTTFNSTLIYNPRDIRPQLSFMRIYSTPQIFRNYSKMIQGDVNTEKFSKKIYYATLNSNKGVVIQELIPNQKYKIIIEGVRDIISNFENNNVSYPFRLELIMEKSLNTSIENMYGLMITSFNFSKI